MNEMNYDISCFSSLFVFKSFFLLDILVTCIPTYSLFSSTYLAYYTITNPVYSALLYFPSKPS